MLCPSLDHLTLLALTIWGEARSEPDDGKLAVAWACMNRAALSGKPVGAEVLKKLQFSFWNSDDPSRPTIASIDASGAIWVSCYKAACAAYFSLLTDPTNGATHYLNEAVTKALRGGSLPDWFDEAKVTKRIGRHTFLRL